MTARRNFLYAASLAAAATCLPRWAWSTQKPRHDPFGLGVASGEPSADGMVLWTRLQPSLDPGEALQPLTVHWELAHDSAFQRIAQRGQAMARPEWGHSVHVELKGLAPDRWFYYRFMCGDAVSPTGRTRTAPAPHHMAPHLRLAFASCQRWEHGHYAAWHHLCAEQPDLLLFLGDYIYESASPRDTTGLARIHSLRHAQTLADFRDRYALYKSDPALQAAHALCPWAVIWDDHEVQNDYAGAQGRDGPTADFGALRSAAFQAFYENMPLRASSLAQQGFAQLCLHRRLAWGRLAQLHLLDTRQYRDWQACRPRGAGTAPAVNPGDCPAWSDPASSLLGADQERWLDEGLAADAHGKERDGGRTRWSVLAQQTLFAPRVYPSGVRSTDSWDGYPAARARLLQSIQGHAPRNTVLLGGDIHQNYVCKVHANPEQPDSPVVASEFCGTSISSRSGAKPEQVAAIVRHNPHILLARSDLRGYGIADITPERWTTTLRVVDDAMRLDSGVQTLAKFVVEDRRAGPELVSS